MPRRAFIFLSPDAVRFAMVNHDLLRGLGHFFCRRLSAACYPLSSATSPENNFNFPSMCNLTVLFPLRKLGLVIYLLR